MTKNNRCVRCAQCGGVIDRECGYVQPRASANWFCSGYCWAAWEVEHPGEGVDIDSTQSTSREDQAAVCDHCGGLIPPGGPVGHAKVSGVFCCHGCTMAACTMTAWWTEQSTSREDQAAVCDHCGGLIPPGVSVAHAEMSGVFCCIECMMTAWWTEGVQKAKQSTSREDQAACDAHRCRAQATTARIANDDREQETWIGIAARIAAAEGVRKANDALVTEADALRNELHIAHNEWRRCKDIARECQASAITLASENHHLRDSLRQANAAVALVNAELTRVKLQKSKTVAPTVRDELNRAQGIAACGELDLTDDATTDEVAAAIRRLVKERDSRVCLVPGSYILTIGSEYHWGRVTDNGTLVASTRPPCDPSVVHEIPDGSLVVVPNPAGEGQAGRSPWRRFTGGKLVVIPRPQVDVIYP